MTTIAQRSAEVAARVEFETAADQIADCVDRHLSGVGCARDDEIARLARYWRAKNTYRAVQAGVPA